MSIGLICAVASAKPLNPKELEAMARPKTEYRNEVKTRVTDRACKFVCHGCSKGA